MSADLLRLLFETTLATSAAALLVLALRRPLMARLGASVAYAAWTLVPVSALAMLLPAPQAATMPMARVVRAVALQPLQSVQAPASLSWTSLALALWALGAAAAVALFARQQWRFQRRLADSVPRADGLRIARTNEGLPAVIGLLRPRIVLPADFDARYDATEPELILCHERIHVARRDLWANAVVAALRALFWFNPLLHHAARRFRRDQELACDERVVARHPPRRRSYADAMLKTQMADSPLPVGCHWQASTPLKERIAMLKAHAPGPARSIAGAALVSLLLLGGGYAAWAAQPAKVVEAKSGSLYSVSIALTLDDATQNIRMVTTPGEPFSFVVRTDKGRAWTGEMLLEEWKHEGRDGAMLSTKLSADGKLVSSPKIGVLLGQSGSIEVQGEGGKAGFRMEATVDKLAAGEGLLVKPAQADEDRSDAAAHVDIASKNTNPPLYPADAARNGVSGKVMGVSGKVMVVVDVGADGSVVAAKIEKSDPAGVFDDAVMAAVQKWKFEPAIENGKPVAGRVRVPVDFQVDPPASQDNG